MQRARPSRLLPLATMTPRARRARRGGRRRRSRVCLLCSELKDTMSCHDHQLQTLCHVAVCLERVKGRHDVIAQLVKEGCDLGVARARILRAGRGGACNKTLCVSCRRARERVCVRSERRTKYCILVICRIIGFNSSAMLDHATASRVESLLLSAAESSMIFLAPS